MAPTLIFLFFLVLCNVIDGHPSDTTIIAELLEENNEINSTTLSPQEEDDILADAILAEIRDKVNSSQVEPLPVGGVSFLTDGQFRGLSSIRREGPARRHDNHTLVIPAVLERGETVFNWTFSLLFTRANGIATVRTTRMPLSLHVHAPTSRSSDHLAELQICDVPHMRGLTVQVGGAGNLNFLTSRVAAIALGLTRSSLTRQLQDPLCAFIATVL